MDLDQGGLIQGSERVDLLSCFLERLAYTPEPEDSRYMNPTVQGTLVFINRQTRKSERSERSVKRGLYTRFEGVNEVNDEKDWYMRPTVLVKLI